MIFNEHTPIVLVVDDEPVNVELLATLLNQEYQVKVAGDGKTALEIVQQFPQPDLILLDVMMPEMDGFEVCKILKTDQATRDIPVIFITAVTGKVSESKGLQLGAVDYITKPFNRVMTLLRVKNQLAFIQSKRQLIEHGGFLKVLVDDASHGMWVISSRGELLLINKAALNLLEYDSQDQAANLAKFDFVDKLYKQQYNQFNQQALTGDTSTFAVEVCALKSTRRWLEITLSPLLDASNQIIAVLSIASDITQRKQAEATLRLSAKVFESAQEGIIITDLQGNITEVNPAFFSITGYTEEEVLGENPRILQSGLQTAEFYQYMWKTINDTGQWQGEMWDLNKKGELYAVWLTVTCIVDDTERGEHYLGVFTDITEIKRHAKQLENIAHFDSLTGVPNRLLLGDRLKQSIASSKREQKLLAVCYLDLDGFKGVNDTLGHEVGDLVLIECAKRILSEIREMDTVARLGGDEFVILLQNIDHIRECSATLERLLTAISAPVNVDGQMCAVSASIGVSIYPLDNEEPDTLLRHADQAMYIAKQSGKNCFHIFDIEQDDRLRSFNENLQQIKSALVNNEMELFYQPKVNLQVKEVKGAEALIRWRHPERGVVSPIEFLPFIHQTSLEIELGDWVIDTALKQLWSWWQQGLLIELSVNITVNHLQEESFVSKLQDKLAKYPELTNGSLQFEILESAALEDFNKVRATINDCQQLGVSFALDDFGTGYSSLTFLRNLPAQTIKVDQTFVRDMMEDKGDYAIIESVISLANTFKRDIVAEGVENMNQFEALAEMGCHFAQGFVIARPMPATEFFQWCSKKVISNVSFVNSP